jgi:DinB superfamily
VVERTDLARTIQLSEGILAINAAATELCSGLSADQLSWRPRSNRWSIAQNLAHLRITTQVFLPTIDAALEKSRLLQPRSDGLVRLTPYGHLLVWQMDARPILKLRAPRATRPQLSDSSTQELEMFLLAQAAMRQRVDDAKGLNITAYRFPSPLARYLRINLLEFFSMFNAHSRRHLWQAHKVRQAMLRVGFFGTLVPNGE